ncbi:hypothetical protein CKA32_002364 [Geitlerinema sp. FC II]|nr:hypothetical protein CKA32_002364 [Geitlerinema sp. FC II]
MTKRSVSGFIPDFSSHAPYSEIKRRFKNEMQHRWVYE